MDNSIFLQLSVMLVVAGTVSAIMRLLRQPLLIGYIITGILLGPAVLHFFDDSQSFAAFSNLGVALLLFIVGLELNSDIIRRLGRAVFFTTLAGVLFTTLVATAVVGMFGLPFIEALIIGLALSFSSTIIIVKILIDKRELTQLYGQVTLGITLLEDVIASFVLIFVGANHSQSLLSGVGLVLKGSAVAVSLFLVARFVLPRLMRFVASSQEFLFLFALAWGFSIASLFDLIGFSLAVGALFAGVSLASQPYSQEIAAKLKPLRDFFVVIFFVIVGGGLQINHLAGVLPLGILLAVVVLIIKPAAAMLTMSALAYTKRTSFKTAVALSQISEFSLILIVLAAQHGLVPESATTLVTLVALLTIAANAYIMQDAEKLFAWLDSRLRLFERKSVKAERNRRKQEATYKHILFGYHKGGTEFIRAFQSMHEPYVVIDYDPEVARRTAEEGIVFKYGDAADPELLDEIGLEKASLVVSTITNFDINRTLVRHVHHMNSRATIVCHADNTEQSDALYELGATYVMLPHLTTSQQLSGIIRDHGPYKHALVPYRQKQQTELAQRPDVALHSKTAK